jgi:hypothetical protein
MEFLVKEKEAPAADACLPGQHRLRLSRREAGDLLQVVVERLTSSSSFCSDLGSRPFGGTIRSRRLKS